MAIKLLDYAAEHCGTVILGVKLGDNKIANFHIAMYDFVDSRQL